MSKLAPGAMAAEALSALDGRRQIAPFTARHPDIDMSSAYAAAAAARALRQARGETPVGRKIGFTNRAIWAQYNVDAPIWGTMYDTTCRTLAANDIVTLQSLCEPQIEPEIALGLSHAPQAGMAERDLLDCVDYVAHGFEIVQSIYPHWSFKAPDTVINFGMHGLYRMGEPLAVTAQNRDGLFEALQTLTLVLSRDGAAVESGQGVNVLGNPLSALRHLVELLAQDPHNLPVAAGEVITTGTLTRAFPVKAGEVWSTHISGIALSGIGLRFG